MALAMAFICDLRSYLECTGVFCWSLWDGRSLRISSASCCYLLLFIASSHNLCLWRCIASVGALVLLLLCLMSSLPSSCPTTVSHVSRCVQSIRVRAELHCIQGTLSVWQKLSLHYMCHCAWCVTAIDGVVLATEKKQKSILYDDQTIHKVEEITQNVGMVYSGMGPDYRYFRQISLN